MYKYCHWYTNEYFFDTKCLIIRSLDINIAEVSQVTQNNLQNMPSRDKIQEMACNKSFWDNCVSVKCHIGERPENFNYTNWMNDDERFSFTISTDSINLSKQRLYRTNSLSKPFAVQINFPHSQ
ncbi:hypothetical protein CEXT_18911 [Caerostris extrusa]|uniref:Uncharacterized protein n=1 Tax=Caerostris extrusa TaxID=172846 RepID=A0AAV4VES6_CAEEX|nr:hypothetical protein CEXT_18911 [Caerostris extrusa]